MHTLAIHPEPYDFNAVLRNYQPDPLFQVTDRSVTLILPNGNLGGIAKETDGLVLLCSDPEADLPHLERIFQLKDQRQELLQPYRTGELAELLDRYSGLPLLLEPSPEHALYRAILHQQISMAAAYTLTRRLLEAYGTEQQGLFAMPAAQVLAELSPEQYRSLGLNRSKAETMQRVSIALKEGHLVLPDSVDDEAGYQQLKRMLLSLKGIGEWTVQCVALFGYAYPHLVPLADLGLQEALKRWYNLPERPDKAWLKDWGARHNRAGSYLTFYLWHWRRG